MDPEKILDECMKEEGQNFGFSSVGAEFTDYRNLVVRWRRTNRWIRLKISDYLKDAPEEIIRSLAHVIFEQICGGSPKYPDELMSWLTDPSFSLRHRDTFLSRNPAMTGCPKGVYRDLSESYARLRQQGLVEDDPDILICWNATTAVKHPTQYSVLMKTIAVTDLLDDPEVPDHVIDWLIYHDLCIVQSGYDPYCAKRTVPEKVAKRYPKMDEAIEFLDWFFDRDDGDED